MHTDQNLKSQISNLWPSVPHLWLIILLLLPSVTIAQSKWTLTTAEFRSRQVELVSLDDAGAKVKDASGAQAIQWDSLLALERESAPPQQGAAGGKFVLHLSGGDQLRGEPVKLEGETLQWKSPAVGTMGVSLRQVSGLVRANRAVPAIETQRTEDVVLLANGDSVRGILSDITAEGLSIQSGGNAVPVPLDSVAAVIFASTAASGAPPAGRAFRVRLDDGSTVTAPSLKSAGEKLVLSLSSGDARELPLASVQGIEQLNGPVSWLSSRPPSESVQTPLLETSRPARMDRTVTGKPMRFGDRTFARGIGVAPFSRITWPLDEARKDYAAFRTQYAIDGTAPYADVTVRIKLGEKVVHEKKNVIAGVLSPVVVIPIDPKAESLTLEVDFGENYGVQDRLNWIEPALLKSSAIPQTPAPTSTPATAPRSGRAEGPPLSTTRSTQD